MDMYKHYVKIPSTRFSIWTLIAIIALFYSCETKKETIKLADFEIANKWAEMTLYILKNTPANSPTFASRSIGYIGLTMYESIVNGYPEYNSMVGQLNGLDQLPQSNTNEEYNWKIALNAGQSSILKNIYLQTSDENKLKIDSLHNELFAQMEGEIEDKEVLARSEKYGVEVAERIFEWSKTDGGHRAYLKNFDKDWSHPVFSGSWQPPLFSQSFSHHPLHPYWGKNRTFLKINSELAIPSYMEYDTTPGSTYYEQFKSVYDKDLTLTQSEKEAALWWGDDPDVTFTPPGHSYYIAMKIIDDRKPNLIECAETFARIGMAVADAFINCWKWKYHYFTERPNTFIPKYIDQTWESFWPDPPFPAFPSGHAIQAATAASVLIDLFGEEFTFVDDSHAGRERDEIREVDFVPRKFNKFWDVAVETANSRFYGGIHIPLDNQVGLEEGKRIAENVNHLRWKN